MRGRRLTLIVFRRQVRLFGAVYESSVCFTVLCFPFPSVLAFPLLILCGLGGLFLQILHLDRSSIATAFGNEVDADHLGLAGLDRIGELSEPQRRSTLPNVHFHRVPLAERGRLVERERQLASGRDGIGVEEQHADGFVAQCLKLEMDRNEVGARARSRADSEPPDKLELRGLVDFFDCADVSEASQRIFGLTNTDPTAGQTSPRREERLRLR